MSLEPATQRLPRIGPCRMGTSISFGSSRSGARKLRPSQVLGEIAEKLIKPCSLPAPPGVGRIDAQRLECICPASAIPSDVWLIQAAIYDRLRRSLHGNFIGYREPVLQAQAALVHTSLASYFRSLVGNPPECQDRYGVAG